MINDSETILNRHLSLKNAIPELRIDHLLSNQDYQLHIKVHSQAGQTGKVISFRTGNDGVQKRLTIESILIVIAGGSFLLTLVACLTGFIMIRFCRRFWTKRGW